MYCRRPREQEVVIWDLADGLGQERGRAFEALMRSKRILSDEYPVCSCRLSRRRNAHSRTVYTRTGRHSTACIIPLMPLRRSVPLHQRLPGPRSLPLVTLVPKVKVRGRGAASRRSRRPRTRSSRRRRDQLRLLLFRQRRSSSTPARRWACCYHLWSRVVSETSLQSKDGRPPKRVFHSSRSPPWSACPQAGSARAEAESADEVNSIAYEIKSICG